MSTNLERLHVRIIPRDELPSGYAAITFPISIKQVDLIASIWLTLHYADDALATLSDGTIQFWRRRERLLGKASKN